MHKIVEILQCLPFCNDDTDPIRFCLRRGTFVFSYLTLVKGKNPQHFYRVCPFFIAFELGKQSRKMPQVVKFLV